MAAKRSRWEDSRRFCGPEETESSPEESESRQTSKKETKPSGEPSPGDSSSSGGESSPERDSSPEPGSSTEHSDGGEQSSDDDESQDGGFHPDEEEHGVSKATEEGRGAPKASEEGSAGGPGVNIFANDGSFLELFKRKMEAAQNPEPPAATVAPTEEQEKKRPTAFSFVGKRRGGTKLALKTGIVAKKQKTEDEISSSKGGAWAQYMAEVKKYKAHQCSDDDKTRPLVK
ncbi:telomerase RNA component interacting RNase [Lissotriton helveticus]